MSDVIAINNKTKPGEPKMTNHKIRNPFPMIGKVYKYEFLNLSRKIFPLLSALVLLALIIGIAAPKMPFLEKESLEYAIEQYESKGGNVTEAIESEMNNTEVQDDSEDQDVKFGSKAQAVIFSIAIVILSFYVFISLFIMIFLIDKSIKKGLVEHDAHFNFTLPVTPGEHIVGRILTYITFFIIWGLACDLALPLGFIKYLSAPLFKMGYYFAEEIYVINGPFSSVFNAYIAINLVIFSIAIFLSSMAMFERTLLMLFKKLSVLISLAINIPIIFFWIRMIYNFMSRSISENAPFVLPFVLFNLAFTVVYLVTSTIIYNKKINI